ncbi:MAG: hypothetical protein KA319_13795 [Ferruginibacter sp.]|nr:hypothetical protein [Ferruginibacter sp.]
MKKVIMALVMFNITIVAFSQTEIAPPPPPTDVMDAVPPPPPPPPPPPIYKNKQGYNITVWNNNGNGMVTVKKKGFKKEIPLKEWNANKAKYEKTYGKVPPPPPPPMEEDVKFTPPVIRLLS